MPNEGFRPAIRNHRPAWFAPRRVVLRPRASPSPIPLPGSATREPALTRRAYQGEKVINRRTLRSFRSGDPEAVRALYDGYGKAVFTVAVKTLGDRWLAEEAVQQTFLKAWRAADDFDVERDPGPWLYAIARRVAIDLYRRERRHAFADLPDEDPGLATLPPSIEQTWQTWEVRLAVDGLPEKERVVVRCTHLLGLTHAETARRLGIPVGTVKSRSARAHRRLEERLEHLRGDGEEEETA